MLYNICIGSIVLLKINSVNGLKRSGSKVSPIRGDYFAWNNNNNNNIHPNE